MELIFKAGPTLIARDWHYDETRGAGQYVETDVTDRAAQLLFEAVTLEPEVSLRDLFMLLVAHPVLKEVFARDWAEELTREVLASGETAPVRIVDSSDDTLDIEYLELYQVISLNSATREVGPMHQWELHGIGFEEQEDRYQDESLLAKKGQRVQWSLSFLSPVKLLRLPIRIKWEAAVCEDNVDSNRYAESLQVVTLSGITLGQVFQAVLWELSFHGGPEAREAESAELKKRVTELKEEGARFVSASKFLRPGQTEALAMLFQSMAGVAEDDLDWAIRKVPDAENMQLALRVQFGEALLVAPAYKDLSAIAFRAAYRGAREAVEDDID